MAERFDFRKEFRGLSEKMYTRLERAQQQREQRIAEEKGRLEENKSAASGAGGVNVARQLGTPAKSDVRPAFELKPVESPDKSFRKKRGRIIGRMAAANDKPEEE